MKIREQTIKVIEWIYTGLYCFSIALLIMAFGTVLYFRDTPAIIVTTALFFPVFTMTFYYLRSSIIIKIQSFIPWIEIIPTTLYILSVAIIVAVIPVLGYKLDPDGITYASEIYNFFYQATKAITFIIIVVFIADMILRLFHDLKNKTKDTGGNIELEKMPVGKEDYLQQLKMKRNLRSLKERNNMKTIELNMNATLVLSLIIAGAGSILPSFFNLAGYMSGLVYLIVAIALLTTYKRKMFFKINNTEPKNQSATPAKSDTDAQIKKLRELEQGSGL